MALENIEIVQRQWQAYEKAGLDGMAEFWADDISWRAIEGALDDVGEMHGIAAMRRYLDDWLETFENVTTVPVELVDLGDDQVLAVVRAGGRARLSGVEAHTRYAIVYTIRDGKIVRGREYADRSEALRAVGREP